MAISTTKSIQIERPASDVFAFVSDLTMMPKWAIHNVKAIRPLGDGSWQIETPRGPGQIVPHFRADCGILDHEFIDPREGRWSVPARVVPVDNSTSAFIITLRKPDTMPEYAFAPAMRLMDEELAALKSCVERL